MVSVVQKQVRFSKKMLLRPQPLLVEHFLLMHEGLLKKHMAILKWTHDMDVCVPGRNIFMVIRIQYSSRSTWKH